jgi:hypothetical protein
MDYAYEFEKFVRVNWSVTFLYVDF